MYGGNPFGYGGRRGRGRRGGRPLRMLPMEDEFEDMMGGPGEMMGDPDGMMGGPPGMGGYPGMGGPPGMGGYPGMGGPPGMGGYPGMGGPPGMGGYPGMGGPGGMMGGRGRGSPPMFGGSALGGPMYGGHEPEEMSDDKALALMKLYMGFE